jgi:hypothetical protein
MIDSASGAHVGSILITRSSFPRIAGSAINHEPIAGSWFGNAKARARRVVHAL